MASELYRVNPKYCEAYRVLKLFLKKPAKSGLYLFQGMPFLLQISEETEYFDRAN